jgi:integrase
MTLGEVLDAWLEAARPRRSASTVQGYIYKVKRIKAGLDASRPVDDLTALDLDRFYAALLEEGLAPATVRQVHAILSAALHQAEKWELVRRNVARLASPPPLDRPRLPVPTKAEVRELIRTVRADSYLAVAVTLAAATGARRGELCALTWNDVDWDGSAVTVSKAVQLSKGHRTVGSTKTHRSRRVALDATTLGALRAWRFACGDPPAVFYVLGGLAPMHPDALSRDFRKLCGGRWRFHDLRHFSVTELVAAGVDVRTVAERVGHARATMTLDRYAHALPERDREAADVLESVLTSDTNRVPES